MLCVTLTTIIWGLCGGKFKWASNVSLKYVRNNNPLYYCIAWTTSSLSCSFAFYTISLFGWVSSPSIQQYLTRSYQIYVQWKSSMFPKMFTIQLFSSLLHHSPFLLEIRSTAPLLTVHIRDLKICSECRTLSPRKNFSTEIQAVLFGLSMPLTFAKLMLG